MVNIFENFIVVTIPKDAYGFKILKIGTSKFLYDKKPFIREFKQDTFLPELIFIDIPKDNDYKILGVLGDLPEEVYEKFVEKYSSYRYKNYAKEVEDPYIRRIQPCHNFAIHSFLSLLHANGVDVTKTLLIIEIKSSIKVTY